MSPVGFERAILASERPQYHALSGVATGIGAKQRIWRRELFLRLTGIELQIVVLPARNLATVQPEVYQRIS
jgi:hypothetical protein